MQLKPQQLGSHLNKTLLPIYLISGDTPLLVTEIRDSIRAAAHKAGYTQRDVLAVEPGFHWDQFTQTTQNLGLFSNKQVIEIHNPNTKFDDAGKKALLHYLDNPSDDHIIIIVTGKLTGAQQKTKWCKAIDAVGALIPVWPVATYELPKWIQARMSTFGLKANAASIALLAELTEGNLLATHQAIEKLNLLSTDKNITEQDVMAAACDSAKFNVFDLVNYALQGNSERVSRILIGLQQEGSEATFVLWALTREIRQLLNLTAKIHNGSSIQQVIAREWSSRKGVLEQALRRHNSNSLLSLIRLASQVDQSIKGIAVGNPWDLLLSLSLGLCLTGVNHATA